MKKMMLFDKEEITNRILEYENSLKENNEGDIDFLRQIEQDLFINIYDIQTINIFGVEYLKVLYYDD
jgi:hypothetical protein